MMLHHAFTNGVADGTNTQVVRPSDWNSAHIQAMTISGNTAGTSSFSGTNIVLQGGNNVTLSANTAAGAATVVVSGPDLSPYLTTAQPPGAYLTTAAQSNHSHNFATTTTNGANIVVGTANSAGATIGVPAFLTTAQPVGAYLTTARASNDAIGLNTALTGNGVSVTANSSGLSINVPAFLTTAQPVGAYLTTARASNDAIGLNTALTGNGVSVTANSSGLSINVPAFLTTAAQSNHSHNLATTTTNGSQIVVATTNSAGATFAVPPFITTYAAQTNQTQASGNIAGVGTTFNGTNVSGSMTLNSNGLRLDLSGQGGGVINQTGPNIAAGTQTATSGTVVFANSNGITFGMSDSTQVTASFDPINIGVTNAGNTAGTTGTIDGKGAQFLFHGGNNITLSQSINGQSATLSIVGGGGGGGITRTFKMFNDFGGATTRGSGGVGTVVIRPVFIDEAVQFSQFIIPCDVTHSSSAVSSGQVGYTANLALYSRGTGTNSTRIESFWSTSHTAAASISSNTSIAVSGISGFANSTSYQSFSSTSTNGVGASSLFHGAQRIMQFPIGSTLTPGDYWLAFMQSSSAAGTAGNQLRVSAYSNVDGGGFVVGTQFGAVAVGNTAYIGPNIFAGRYSISTGAFPANINSTQVYTFANPFFQVAAVLGT